MHYAHILAEYIHFDYVLLVIEFCKFYQTLFLEMNIYSLSEVIKLDFYKPCRAYANKTIMGLMAQ